MGNPHQRLILCYFLELYELKFEVNISWWACYTVVPIKFIFAKDTVAILWKSMLEISSMSNKALKIHPCSSSTD